MNKQEQIDWLYTVLCAYDGYAKCGDMTFLDDIPKDKAYVEKHFDLTNNWAKLFKDKEDKE